jgi:hypothetical protein
VVSEHPEYRLPEVADQSRHSFDCCVVRTKRRAAKIARQNAYIVLQLFDQFTNPQHGTLVHVHVRVADVEDRKAFEERWQATASDVVRVQDDALGIPATAPVKAARLQDGSDNTVNRVPVLDVKEVETLSENPGLMIGFDPDALSGV